MPQISVRAPTGSLFVNFGMETRGQYLFQDRFGLLIIEGLKLILANSDWQELDNAVARQFGDNQQVRIMYSRFGELPELTQLVQVKLNCSGVRARREGIYAILLREKLISAAGSGDELRLLTT